MKEELLPIIIVTVVLAAIYLAMRTMNIRAKGRMKNRKFGWRK